MKELSFITVIDSARKMIQQLIDEHQLKVNKLKDDAQCYRVIIEFKNCMEEIIVNHPDFAPYRFVQIEILSSISDKFDQIYCWYDQEGDDIQTILFHIQESITIGNCYC